MDPGEYEDLLARVSDQLPWDVRRWVTISLDRDDPSAPPLAIFTRRDGRARHIARIQPDGRISNFDIARLCVMF
jgi:hypothetical protein